MVEDSVGEKVGRRNKNQNKIEEHNNKMVGYKMGTAKKINVRYRNKKPIREVMSTSK